ncbi:MAG TPA: SAM-dependent methyltransferase [Actinobacteria bacterium]|jgi:tRNA (adenine57-N1/adenine58-N1)-methyltransferase|nr:SAM-dependent methyltransferase [Actinomycetota bacterium]HCP62737.1 SAM-dependent methyltransferase [Actinomycetota bacterium]
MSAPFATGDRVLLMDDRKRRFLVRLEPGQRFHYHGGWVAHDEILGQDEGVVVFSQRGGRLVGFRPRLADFVLKMPRGAQVIYPKEIGAILVEADIAPGTAVLEAGTGSAALTMALARATGPTGRVVSYELREDHQARAVANMEMFLGAVPPWVELRLGDVREVAATGEEFDRAVLDLPDPGGVLPQVAQALRRGAMLCTFLPTTNQVQECVLALRAAGFGEVETFELLRRVWHVEARSVRPDHRMVGHTGFLTVGRKGAPQPGPEDEPKDPEDRSA